MTLAVRATAIRTATPSQYPRQGGVVLVSHLTASEARRMAFLADVRAKAERDRRAIEVCTRVLLLLGLSSISGLVALLHVWRS